MVSVLYSLPVHECSECVEQLCRGILHFDPTAGIVLHISKSQPNSFLVSDNTNIFINPQQFETSWGFDMSRVHVSNFLYAKTKKVFSHMVIISSNMLQLRDIKQEVIKNDVGYSIPRTPENHVSPLVDEDYKKGFAYCSALENKIFKQILTDLNFSDIYTCVLDGTYMTTNLMEELVNIYLKYYNFSPQPNFAFEEAFFPTIICNLHKGKIHNSLTYEHTHTLELFKFGLVKNFHFAKKVERNMTSEIRKYYEDMLK